MLDSVIISSVIHETFFFTLCFPRVDCPRGFSQAVSPTPTPHPITENKPIAASPSDMKVALLWNQLHVLLSHWNATAEMSLSLPSMGNDFT
jgi:hypothetical protein